MSAFKNIPSLIGGTAVVAAATIGLTARPAPAGTATARTGQACRGALAVPSQGRTSPNDRFGAAGDRPAQSVEPVFSQAVGEVGELGRGPEAIACPP